MRLRIQIMGRHMKSHWILGLSTSALMAAAGWPIAIAQTPDQGIEEPTERIVVTGSRIVRQDFVAESPILTVDQEAFQNTGTPAIDQTLNQLPQFNASATGQAQGGSTGASRGGNRATANLRGLGTARTLVLLDGRRLQPSDPLGSVDLNAISSALLQNVEIITGGASAVYGSDAVAGVVNFRLNTAFTGFRVDADYGLTERGDGQTSSIALTFGDEFAGGRGHSLLSLSYLDRGEILIRDVPFLDDRAGACCFSSGLIIPSGANLWSSAVLQQVFGSYGTSSPPISAGLSVNADGTLFGATPSLNLRYTEADGFFVAPSGQTQQRLRPDDDPATIMQPMQRYTAFGRTSFEITPMVTAFAQFSYARYEAESVAPGILQATQRPLTVRADNPFVPADLATILSSRPNPDAPFIYYFTSSRIAPLRFQNTYNVGQFMAGLSGVAPVSDWTWEVYGSTGFTDQQDRYQGYVSRTAMNNLINAADGGAALCDGGYDLFSLAPVSESCSDYLSRTVQSASDFRQQILEANMQGRLFDLPAGEARFAAGAGYRYNFYDYRPDAQLVTQEVLGTSGVNASSGSTDVYEAYGEALLPLLADLPLIEQFNLSLAYRFSNYDTVGGVHTYRASGDWLVADGLRVRGGYSRAIRAPSVGELFAARSAVSSQILTTLNGGGDPCDIRSVQRTGPDAAQVRGLCLEQGVPEALIDTFTFGGSVVSGFTVGNTELAEEVADSFTIGAVFTPTINISILSQLTLAIDYFDIDVQGAIANITSFTSLQRCFNREGDSNPGYSPDNSFCQNIGRDPAGQLALVEEPAANLGGYRTSGVDLQADWRADVADLGLARAPGVIGFNIASTYVDRYQIQTEPGQSFLEYAGTIGNGTIDPLSISHPRWKHSATATYAHGPASVGLRWRYIGAMDDASNIGSSSNLAPGVGATQYWDVNLRWNLPRDVQLRAGVVNLFNTEPPEWSGQSRVDSATYDLQGRRYFVGASKTF